MSVRYLSLGEVVELHRLRLTEMMFILCVVGLLLFSATGSILLRHAGPDRYAPFIYTCALWWALLPALTGDWVWTLFAVPTGLFVARHMVRRRAREVAARSASEQAD